MRVVDLSRHRQRTLCQHTEVSTTERNSERPYVRSDALASRISLNCGAALFAISWTKIIGNCRELLNPPRSPNEAALPASRGRRCFGRFERGPFFENERNTPLGNRMKKHSSPWGQRASQDGQARGATLTRSGRRSSALAFGVMSLFTRLKPLRVKPQLHQAASGLGLGALTSAFSFCQNPSLTVSSIAATHLTAVRCHCSKVGLGRNSSTRALPMSWRGD